MLKKTITFTDYDGHTRTGDYYFNLNKAEIIQWMTTSGEYTLDKVLLRLAEERNGQKIMSIFEDLIKRSYGIKSLDGVQFVKNEEIWNSFRYSEAYSELFSELVTDAQKASAFVNGIIPASLAEEATKALLENKDGIPDELKDYVPQITNPTT